MNTPLNRLSNGFKKENENASSHTPKISVDAPGYAASVGARIRKLRLALGYTRPAFGDAIGVTSSALIAWESEGAAPSSRSTRGRGKRRAVSSRRSRRVNAVARSCSTRTSSPRSPTSTRERRSPARACDRRVN